jgi:hypothetical protein
MLGVGTAAAPADAAAEPKLPDAIADIRTANEALRTTAKWILTSFAAVGALLVAGLQLSSVGKLTGDVPHDRIFAALGGVALATLGIAIAIWFTSTVLAPSLNSFRTADEENDVTRDVLGDGELVGCDYAGLKAEIKKADAALKEAAKKGVDDPDYKTAYALREDWEVSKGLALTAVGSELLWRRYKRARLAVMFAIALIAAGLVGFAWGANPPATEKTAPPVALSQAPLHLTVTLTPAGVAGLKTARGCSEADVNVLAISGTAAAREVVTVPSPSCKSVRFILTPSLGTAVAA